MRIAIQPDDYGPNDSSSKIWAKILTEVGHDVIFVNVYHADIIEQLRGCHGFMWRFAHTPAMCQIAKTLLPALERHSGILVYPDQHTCWHYDDKAAQANLFALTGTPTPKTWVWYDQAAALDWAREADYPLVMKLRSGAGSTNVRLIHSFADATCWIKKIFSGGVESIDPQKKTTNRLRQVARLLVRGEARQPWSLHKNYVLFQEFLPGNDFDTRVTVIGNRAFAFRRFNRGDDFRASGSDRLDHNPDHISSEMIQLALQTAEKLDMQSCAMDFLWRDEEPVIGEISYTYASWAVHKCPGHWDKNLTWHKGQMWPEEAQATDFMARLTATFGEK
ncbi:MAG: hypothetical protein P1P74_01415 [Desulfuromonadales bacterium]|nr:hypothetical protein [Desulfuromonadales bacterium]